MLDTIVYSQNPDGSIEKTITNTVSDIAQEIYALQQQLAAFEAGTQSPDIAITIANYSTQILLLQGLG